MLGSEIRGMFQSALRGARSINYILSDIVEENSDILLQLNKDQLLSGRNINEEYLSPEYTQDPYFSTPEKAANYQRFKEAIISDHNSRKMTNLFSPKPIGVPNLIITGSFQDQMTIATSFDSFYITSTFRETSDIESKYNNLVFGISNTSRDWFFINYIKEQLLKSLINGM